jgi:hypothetical protein
MNPNDPNVALLEVVANPNSKRFSASSPDLQDYLAHEISKLLATPACVDALSGHLPADAASQQRLPELRQKLQKIASLRST